jgi:hypothetical protein
MVVSVFLYLVSLLYLIDSLVFVSPCKSLILESVKNIALKTSLKQVICLKTKDLFDDSIM